MMPARISSLFLIEVPNLTLRCFNSSSLRYSSLGIVKLSRTSLGFLGFSSLVSICFATVAVAVFDSTFTGVLARALAAAVGVALAIDLTAAFGAAFLAAGLASTLATGLTGAATFLAGVRAALLATAFTAKGAGAGADDAETDGADAVLGWSAGVLVGSVARSVCMFVVMVSFLRC